MQDHDDPVGFGIALAPPAHVPSDALVWKCRAPPPPREKRSIRSSN